MECWIRMNHMTMNHMTMNKETEIWEVVSYQTGNVVWWGTATKLTKILGRDNWDAGDTIIWE